MTNAPWRTKAAGVSPIELLFAEVLIEPGDGAGVAVEDVLLLAQTVGFARVEHELDGHFVTLEGAVEDLALRHGVGRIGFALEDEGTPCC